MRTIQNEKPFFSFLLSNVSIFDFSQRRISENVRMSSLFIHNLTLAVRYLLRSLQISVELVADISWASRRYQLRNLQILIGSLANNNENDEDGGA